MKEQLSNLDKLEGNVDSISNRISNVRTWSYVSNKTNWVENQDYWIERTKLLEDKLSDRLHEELIKSFINKVFKEARFRVLNTLRSKLATKVYANLM